MDITKGYLLITDMTGYTEFLVDSELQHAKEILDTLLETNVNSVEPPVRILNTRGDAVLAFAEEDAFVRPESLLESIDKEASQAGAKGFEDLIKQEAETA